MKKGNRPLTLAELLGKAERRRRSPPSSPIVAEGFGLAAETAQGVLLEAVRVVEGETVVLLPLD